MSTPLFENSDTPSVNVDPNIEESWRSVLNDEFKKPYFHQIKEFLLKEKGTAIYPPGKKIFNAFNQTPFDQVKVVILGQDPYHGKGQAHGLCFSVPDGIAQPPSLVNIFKELKDNLGFPVPQTGNLTKWTQQGVFLLNAILTVKANQPASHRNIGWEQFTDAVIMRLSEEKSGLVFLLWGKFAQEKEAIIDTNHHFILKAAHPSPYSANNGFFGCKHFSQTSEILRKQGIEEIDWQLYRP